MTFRRRDGMRAPIEHGLFGDKSLLKTMTCLEPACGRGHMAETLKEYFDKVTASDLLDYNYGHVGRDFLTFAYAAGSFVWVVQRSTNCATTVGRCGLNKSLYRGTARRRKGTKASVGVITNDQTTSYRAATSR